MIKRIKEIPSLLLSWAVFAVCYPAMALHTRLFGPKAPEVPPAEERPYIPVRVKVHLATPDRPELMQNCWAGKSIERILWELSEGVHG